MPDEQQQQRTSHTDHFIQFMSAAEDGALLEELGERLRELVARMHQEAMSRGGKPKGSIGVTFDLKLDGQIVEVSADVRVKEPKTERSRSIFYRLNDNGLSSNNPKQLTMDLAQPRAIEPAREIRVV